MFVRTERMFLRPAWPEDLDDLVQIFGKEDTQCSVGVSPLPRDAAAMGAFLRQARDPRLPNFVMYLRSPGGPRLVGGIALCADENDSVEVSYWIVTQYRGSGFGREALRAVLNQARALGYRRVTATHLAEDTATRRVLESVGFVDAGHVHLRDQATPDIALATRRYVADLAARPWLGLPEDRMAAPVSPLFA